jgi:hypothetical protein
MANVNVKYRIFLLESERGWGKETWTEDYDTLEEALQRIKSVNAQNTAERAPDYYQVAENRVEMIDPNHPVPN